jgi:hypothetical protein
VHTFLKQTGNTVSLHEKIMNKKVREVKMLIDSKNFNQTNKAISFYCRGPY